MSILGERIKNDLPAGMTIPDELEKLFLWAESKGWTQGYDGLTPYLAPYAVEDDGEFTQALFSNEGSMDLALDTGVDDEFEEELEERLYKFCYIDNSGLWATWWLEDDGNQRVVQLGGFDQERSMFADTKDFLRALAVGEMSVADPQSLTDAPDGEYLNKELREWLETELGLEIPKTVAEVAFPTEEGDPFVAWLVGLGY